MTQQVATAQQGVVDLKRQLAAMQRSNTELSLQLSNYQQENSDLQGIYPYRSSNNSFVLMIF